MAEPLTEDDIKFYLSIEPDEEAVRKAVENINQGIEHAKVKKIQLEIEKREGIGAPTLGQKLKGAGGAALGAAGTAAGGAMDVASGALSSAMTAVKSLATAPFKVINAGFGLVADALHDIQGPLGPIGAGLNLFTKGLDTVADTVRGLPIVGDTLGSILGSLAKLPTILKSILEAGTSLAAKASPGTVRMMSMEVENFQATVGQAFVPVVELMTEMVRDLSDVVANFIPNTEEMRGAINEVRKAWGLANTSLKEAAMEIGPAIRETIVGAIKSLGETLAEWMPSLDDTKGALEWIKDMWVKVKDVVVDVTKQVWDFGKGVVDSFRNMMGDIQKLVNDVQWLVNPSGKLDEAKRQAAESAQMLENVKREQAEEFAKEMYKQRQDAEKDRAPGPWTAQEEEGIREKATQVIRTRQQKKQDWGATASGGDWGEEAMKTAKKTPDGSREFRRGIVASRPPWMGGIEEYQKRLQMQSVAGSFGKGPESVPGNVDKIAGAVSGIAGWFAKLSPDKVEAMVKAGGGDRNAARQIVQEAENNANLRGNRR